MPSNEQRLADATERVAIALEYFMHKETGVLDQLENPTHKHVASKQVVHAEHPEDGDETDWMVTEQHPHTKAVSVNRMTAKAFDAEYVTLTPEPEAVEPPKEPEVAKPMFPPPKGSVVKKPDAKQSEI
jgi:hypothetical protein